MKNLENALQRLNEALAETDDNPLIIDGTIQRFEFTIELFWKTLKRLLDLNNIQALTPKETLKQAYKIGWLKDEEKWLQMYKDRNQTSHVYNEDKAKEIYEHIKKNINELNETYELLKKEQGQI